MEREQPMPEKLFVPEPLPVEFDSIPERLQSYEHFVVWKYERVEGDLKKPPFDPKTGKRASISRCDTWGSFAQVKAAYETGRFAGVGIVLFGQMGIVGIDIDHCIENGQITDEAQRILRAMNSYTELSPSGTGIHIFLQGKLPGGFRRRGTIEMYEDMRYLTLTGHRIPHTPSDVQLRHRELYGLYHRVFDLASRQQTTENTGGGIERSPFPLARSDQEVLQKALIAKNGDTFRRYYYGDTSLWEGTEARHTSQSEADFTLVLLLLYWTNNDTIQVDRLFRQSGLMREKWTRPIKGSETYGERIINDALMRRKH
jgi:primase-polymerase (primpol)-like protein